MLRDCTTREAVALREAPIGTRAHRARIALFFANAEEFSCSFGPIEDRYRECVLHGLAIGIELSLKAYLMHAGKSDDWNRLNIRHDLRKALRFAQGAGLGVISSDVSRLVNILSEPYQQHAIHRFALEGGAAPTLGEVRRTVHSLLSIVRARIDSAAGGEDRSCVAEAFG